VTARKKPPLAPISHCMLLEDQSPVMYGKNIRTKAGSRSSPPVT
jgi:hypothetical protein